MTKHGFRLSGRCALVAAVATGLWGCAAGNQLGGDPGLKVYAGPELPAPTQRDINAGVRPYYIGPYDKLAIDVFGVPELAQKEVQVDDTGRITFPPAGRVELGGLTLLQAQQSLAERLRAAFVRDPQVTITVREAQSQNFTATGEVMRPGVFPVIGSMTLMRANALAGGRTDLTDRRHVVVFRIVDGQRLAALYDLKSIETGAHPDPQIYPNDVIVFGESQARRLFKDFLAFTPLVTTPLLIASTSAQIGR